MSESITHIVVVGGGTAGWLSAAVIAAHHKAANSKEFKVTLVESSDIPTIGVGEGTWPTMKNTLHKIGLDEKEVFKRCHAAFKQGAKFINWVHGNGDFYYHPFTVPLGYGNIDLAPYVSNIEDFAVESNFQQQICEAGLAPRTLAEMDYKGTCNYAYHLDAGELANLLKEHCIKNLSVNHIVDTMDDTILTDDGSIDAIVLSKLGKLSGDVFVDCTGANSLLLGKALGIPYVHYDDILFNDRALAMQVPYDNENDPVACHTIATAQDAGWIWDIGLTSRRGVGHVYASRFTTDDEAEANLRRYLGDAANGLTARKISYAPGHREKFWYKNCIAVGMAAGFVEPLEATAIMLIEISSRFIAENVPADKSLLPVTAKRFNKQMDYRWQRIVDFLKLHYMLTQRTEPYWQAHCDEANIPESLKEDLALWRYRGPVTEDFNSSMELFPAASYQYVLYGMEFKPDFSKQGYLYNLNNQAQQIMMRNKKVTEQMLQALPPHRDYIQKWLATSA